MVATPLPLSVTVTPTPAKLRIECGVLATGVPSSLIVNLELSQLAVVALVATSDCPVVGGALPDTTTSAQVVRN